VSLALTLADILPPNTPGNYAWHATVTPRSGKPYELRAAVPVPHVLTLRGRYDVATHKAVLTGTLRANGHTRAGVTIAITRLDRTAVPLTFHDEPVALTATTSSGSFRVTLRMPSTRGFIASALPALRPCIGNQRTPPPCRSSTVSGIQSDPITVSVP
jgi:hypothetical protein